MKLIMVRHALSEENEKGVVCGYRTHGRLSPLGVKQARKTAERLRRERIDVIFSSDLRRAVQTARAIAIFHKNVPFIKSKEIRERDYGNLEGWPADEFIRKRESLGFERHEFRPDGGENYEDVRKRAGRFYMMLTDNYRKKTVLVVSHGEFILNLIGLVLGESPERTGKRKLDNASISIIKIDGKIKAECINSTEHLMGEMDEY